MSIPFEDVVTALLARCEASDKDAATVLLGVERELSELQRAAVVAEVVIRTKHTVTRLCGQRIPLTYVLGIMMTMTSCDYAVAVAAEKYIRLDKSE